MKKILTVVKGLGINGISNVIFTYYRNLDNNKFKMDFATVLDVHDKYRKEIEYNNSQLHLISDRDKNPIKYIIELSKIIKENEYEIVHIHGNSSMIILELIAAILGGARLRIAHSHNTECSNNRLSVILRPVLNLLCNFRIACGIEAGKWMFGNKEFVTLKNGIDMSQYEFIEETRKKIRSELGINNELVVGHIGTFNFQKNHEKLIDIFTKVLDKDRTIKLLLIGDGEKKESIETKIKELKIEKNVILYGISDNVNELIQAIDIFVLPSRFEGLPCVLIEAQALGTPCIVSSNVSKESKFGENVQYIDLDKSSELWAEKILDIDIDNRYEKSKITKKILQSKGYDIRKAIEELETVYSSI